MLTEEPTQRLIGFTRILRIEQTSELKQCFEKNKIGFFIASPALVMASRDYGVVRSLRKRSQYEHLPIIVIRNHPGMTAIKQAYAAGITNVITFPDQLGKIRRLLINALAQNELLFY